MADGPGGAQETNQQRAGADGPETPSKPKPKASGLGPWGDEAAALLQCAARPKFDQAGCVQKLLALRECVLRERVREFVVVRPGGGGAKGGPGKEAAG